MPITKKYGFCKEERLSSRKEIGRLFKEGNSFFFYPFNLIWIKCDRQYRFPVRMAVSVSRKLFKKAVDRNRIKRFTREAWRHEKPVFYNWLDQHKSCLSVMLIYVASDMPSQAILNKTIREMMVKFSLHLNLVVQTGEPD